MEDDDGAEVFAAGVAECSGEDLEVAALSGGGPAEAEAHLGLFVGGAFEGLGDEVLKGGVADDFLDGSSDGGVGRDAEEFGGGVVEAEDAFVEVDGEDAFAHGGEDGAEFVSLLDDVGESSFEVDGHFVEGVGETCES